MNKGELIDIDKVISIWHTGILKPYLNRIENASVEELKVFIHNVKIHKKNQKRLIPAFADSPRSFTIHDKLIQFAKWEIITKSKSKLIYDKIYFPILKLWLWFWRGIELSINPKYGPYQKIPSSNYNDLKKFGLFMFVIKRVLKPTIGYINKNLYWIIPSLVALIIALLITKRS